MRCDALRIQEILTNVDGKDENGDDVVGVGDTGALTGGTEGADVVLATGVSGFVSISPPSLPIFFNQPINSGSFPSAQDTSTSCRPRATLLEEHTAAKASPICLNGTRAVPRLGFLGGAGFNEMTMSETSIAPNDAKSKPRPSGFVRVGRVDNVHFTFTVVSSVP